MKKYSLQSALSTKFWEQRDGLHPSHIGVVHELAQYPDISRFRVIDRLQKQFLYHYKIKHEQSCLFVQFAGVLNFSLRSRRYVSEFAWKRATLMYPFIILINYFLNKSVLTNLSRNRNNVWYYPRIVRSRTYNPLYMKPILENEEQHARRRSERKQRLAHYCSCVITPQLGNAADRIVMPATLKASNDLTINLR